MIPMTLVKGGLPANLYRSEGLNGFDSISEPSLEDFSAVLLLDISQIGTHSFRKNENGGFF